jgi:hypothetical protein
MNEIRLLKDPDSLKVEVEPPDSQPPGLPTSDDRDSLEPDPGEPPFPLEYRIEDRRVAHRYRAKEGRCWIGWKGVGGFQQSAGWIIDISVSGSLVATDAPTPADRPVWLRLDDPAVPEWAEAKVVDLQKAQSGIYAARLVFRGACPYALMKAAAFASSPPPARPTPHHSWNLNAW